MGCTFGMGHQTNHIAALIAYARYCPHRPVGIIGVAQHDLIVGFKRRERFIRAGEVSLEVIDGDLEPLANFCLIREHRIGRHDLEFDGCAKELETGIFCSAPGSRPASVST